MHFVLSPVGSDGDVHPMMGLALLLEQRGHRVTFVVNGFFRELVESSGLEFVELGSRDEFIGSMNHPDLWNPRRAFSHVYRSIVDMLHGARPGERMQLVDGLQVRTFKMGGSTVWAMWDDAATDDGSVHHIQMGSASRQVDLWGRHVVIEDYVTEGEYQYPDNHKIELSARALSNTLGYGN